MIIAWMLAAEAVPPLPDYLLDVRDGVPTDGVIRSSRPPSTGDVVEIITGPGAPFTLVRNETASEPTAFAPAYQVWDAPAGGWQAGAEYTAQFGFATAVFTVGTAPAPPAAATLVIDEVGDWVDNGDGTWTRDIHLEYTLAGGPHAWMVLVGGSDAVRPGADIFRLGEGASGFSMVQTILADGRFANDCVTVYPYAANGDAGAPAEACESDRPEDLDDTDSDVDTDTDGEADTEVGDARGGSCGCDGSAFPAGIGLWAALLVAIRRRR